MIEELLGFVPQMQSLIWALWLVFLRVGAMVSVLPAFGERSIPMRIRLGIALAFTLVVAPAVQGETMPVPPLMEVLELGLPEVLTGLFLGLMLRFFVLALQVAGSIAAQSTSLSQIFGGSAGADPQPAIGHVLVVAGLALAALMGLHVQFAAYIIHSYDLVPQSSILSSTTVKDMGVVAVSRTFALGFVLAAPFVIASLLYNVILGVINKAMPQLMVSFVGAPAITAGGLFILFVSAPVMLAVWLDRFAAFIIAPGAPL